MLATSSHHHPCNENFNKKISKFFFDLPINFEDFAFLEEKAELLAWNVFIGIGVIVVHGAHIEGFIFNWFLVIWCWYCDEGHMARDLLHYFTNYNYLMLFDQKCKFRLMRKKIPYLHYAHYISLREFKARLGVARLSLYRFRWQLTYGDSEFGISIVSTLILAILLLDSEILLKLNLRLFSN